MATTTPTDPYKNCQDLFNAKAPTVGRNAFFIFIGVAIIGGLLSAFGIPQLSILSLLSLGAVLYLMWYLKDLKKYLIIVLAEIALVVIGVLTMMFYPVIGLICIGIAVIMGIYLFWMFISRIWQTTIGKQDEAGNYKPAFVAHREKVCYPYKK